MRTDHRSRKVLLIGWDSADWKVIMPLIDAGKMPNLAKLVENGICGNIATLQPVLSPMLWTSIATGKRAYKHGVHGFSEPDPLTGSIRPVTNLSRKTKAIWNILNQNNLNTITVGWWPSNPVEELSKGFETSRNGLRCGIICQRSPWHPESRGENDTSSACCGSHEPTPRQHSAFPKVCVANIVVAVVRLPDDRGVPLWNPQLLLLSRH